LQTVTNFGKIWLQGGFMEKFKVSVFVTGVKKKGRKADKHLFNVGYVEYKENMTDEEKAKLIEVARGVVETNMKSFLNGFTVNLNHVTLYDGGEIWEPFSDKNLKIKVG
jgi:hypothetical protein